MNTNQLTLPWPAWVTDPERTREKCRSASDEDLVAMHDSITQYWLSHEIGDWRINPIQIGYRTPGDVIDTEMGFRFREMLREREIEREKRRAASRAGRALRAFRMAA